MGRKRYRVEFKRSAEKEYAKLPDQMKKRVVRRLRELEIDPHPPESKRLVAKEDLYRVREGDYRIVYAIEGQQLIILVVRIGHRKDVYRRR